MQYLVTFAGVVFGEYVVVLVGYFSWQVHYLVMLE